MNVLYYQIKFLIEYIVHDYILSVYFGYYGNLPEIDITIPITV